MRNPEEIAAKMIERGAVAAQQTHAAEGTMHKQRIEEWLRANASTPPEDKEKMQRRLVNIIKELVTWMEELEKALAEHG